jgi:sulfatase maturation enzyme AslB (radical SAM superfamily)
MFLDYLIDTGVSHNIKLEYNSNMVAIPDILFDKWEKFKEVEIGCSIDGINEYANYIRHPSNWQVIEKNLDRIGYLNSATIKGILAPTVSVFNIKHIIELIEWLENKRYTNILGMLSLNMLYGPYYLNTQVLPKNVKLEIVELYEKFFERTLNKYGKTTYDTYVKHYSSICNHMMSIDNSEHLPELAHFVYKMDNIRNNKIENTIPWLHQILKDQPKFKINNIS